MIRSLTLLGLFLFVGVCELNAQSDSVILIVLNSLTNKEVHISQPTDKHLQNYSWEALAYWDMQTPKDMGSLNEAVGDMYQFNQDNSFEIRLINPEDDHKVGLTIKGSYILSDGELTLISERGKEMNWKIHFLDTNYLILENDGLRIFYTKGKSYFSYD